MKRETAKVFSKEVKRKTGKTAKETVYYSMPGISTDDMYVVTTMGDRLDLLAKEYYGHRRLWWYIAYVNDLTTVNVQAGIKLRIPKESPLVY